MPAAPCPPMPSQSATTDSSVTFSLGELVELEKDRLREERERMADRERAREASARAEAERVRVKLAEERARADAAQREAALQRAEEAARVAGRKEAELEVARIKATARIRLEADEAARRHELALLREKLDRRAVRGRGALAMALSIAVVGGVGATLVSRSKAARLEQDLTDARAVQATTRVERDAARAQVADRERDAAMASKRAQEALAARVGVLDARRVDLAGWAADRRRSDLLDDVVAAAAAARTSPSEDAIATYGRALDRVRASLGAPARNGTTPRHDPDPGAGQGACTNPNDPLCGFGGRGL